MVYAICAIYSGFTRKLTSNVELNVIWQTICIYKHPIYKCIEHANITMLAHVHNKTIRPLLVTWKQFFSTFVSSWHGNAASLETGRRWMLIKAFHKSNFFCMLKLSLSKLPLDSLVCQVDLLPLIPDMEHCWRPGELKDG